MSDTSGIDGSGTLDTATLMKGYQAAQGQIQSSASDLAQALQTGKEGIQNQEQSSEAAIKAEQAINTLKGAAAAKEQADNAAAAAHFGTNPDAASYIMATLGDRIISDENDIVGRRQMISEKMNQGFLDNPMQWLTNQITLPMDVYAANVKIAGVNQDLDTIHQLQQATREQAATNSIIDQANAATLAERNNEWLATQAQMALGQSQQKLAQLGIQGATLKDAQSKTQLEAMFQLNNALATKQHLEMEQANLPLVQQQRQDSITRTQLLIDEKNTSDQNKAFIQQKLDNFTDSYGMTRVPFEQFKMMTGRMKDIMEQGILAPETDSGRMPGAYQGPAAAINSANMVNAPLTPGMNDIRNKLGKAMDIAHANPMWNTWKPGEQTIKENEEIQKVIGNDLQNIPNEGSIYSPLSMNAMITASPALNDNPLVAELAPLAKKDTSYVANANDIFKTALKMITSGDMTTGAAAENITQLYKTMQIQLNTTKQYARYGIDPLSDASGYKQSVYLGLGYGQTRVVDFTNKADVENAITRSVINSRVTPDYGLNAGAINDAALNTPIMSPKQKQEEAARRAAGVQ